MSLRFWLATFFGERWSSGLTCSSNHRSSLMADGSVRVALSIRGRRGDKLYARRRRECGIRGIEKVSPMSEAEEFQASPNAAAPNPIICN